MTTAPDAAASVREFATLTDEQSDRLYLEWHDQVADEVVDAVAMTTGCRERRAEAFTALQRDLTSIDLSRAAPNQANYPMESTAWKALNARGYLRSAERYYAGHNPNYALKLLQYAAEQSRVVLCEVACSPNV